jgi:hypothetical protein
MIQIFLGFHIPRLSKGGAFLLLSCKNIKIVAQTRADPKIVAQAPVWLHKTVH